MKKLLCLVCAVLMFCSTLVACGDKCDHDWETVTVAPTCSAVGYDTMTCKLCGEIVNTNETARLDHTTDAIYCFDDADHWYSCTVCDAVVDKVSHTPDGEGVCTVCQIPTSVTPGIIYELSEDGTYADVIGYEGTAAKVRIAKEYNGVPVRNIRKHAFSDNQTITSVAIPDSVTYIDEYAFARCPNLLSVVIPDGVTFIGEGAFKNSGLTSVVIPDSVTTLATGVFFECKSLTSAVIGDGVLSLSSTFGCCSNLTSVVIGDSVDQIGSGSFLSCVSLTSIVIPEGVRHVWDGAFRFCSSLESITLPNSLEKIWDGAFDNCYSLAHVYYNGDKQAMVKKAFLPKITYHFNEAPEE